MGGSFNPPHEGHRIVAETALRRLGLQAVWWLVSPGNPLKDHGELASFAERMASCEPFCQSPRMLVTGIEGELQSPFTLHTLKFLKQRYSGVEFVWVMGGDNLAGFHKWVGWRDIAALVPLAVVDRPGWRFKALASPAARYLRGAQVPESRARTILNGRPPGWVYLSTRLSELSSTDLRSGRTVE